MWQRPTRREFSMRMKRPKSFTFFTVPRTFRPSSRSANVRPCSRSARKGSEYWEVEVELRATARRFEENVKRKYLYFPQHGPAERHVYSLRVRVQSAFWMRDHGRKTIHTQKEYINLVEEFRVRGDSARHEAAGREGGRRLPDVSFVQLSCRHLVRRRDSSTVSQPTAISKWRHEEIPGTDLV